MILYSSEDGTIQVERRNGTTFLVRKMEIGRATERAFGEMRGMDSLLTPTERKVFALVQQARSNKEIATAMNIAERTVKFHKASLFAKLGVNSSAELIWKFPARS